jgi:hypothetical protein
MPNLPLFLAQEVAGHAGSDNGFDWQSLFSPAVIWIFIPITAIIVGTLSSIIHKSQQHRERMAMIAAGMHPDFPPDEEVAENTDDTLRETAGYRTG